MQNFTSEPYEFSIDGTEYSIPEMSIDTFEEIGALYEIDNPVKQLAAFRDVLINVADEPTGAAIRKLGVKKISNLFRDWSGIGAKKDGVESGEGSSSAA